jgi:hypothetical protein
MTDDNPFMRALASQADRAASLLDNLKRVQAENRAFEHGFADVMYETLMDEIRDFEETLNPDEEIGAYLSSFGQTVLIQVERVTYANPYLIIFDGFNADSKARVRLIQHTSQISVLFVAVQVKPEEDRKPRRIGFLTDSE